MWVVLIASVVVLGFTKWVHSWRRLKHYEKLPNGSMGFPLLGENLEFLTPHSSFHIAPFIKTRMVRYFKIYAFLYFTVSIYKIDIYIVKMKV